jgi:hypothetical protein
MTDIYALSRSDVDTLKQLVGWWKSTPGRTLNRPHADEQIFYAPEVYIALTPHSGIPPLTPGEPGTGSGSGTYLGTGTSTTNPLDKDRPGSADCPIYRIIHDSTGPFLQQISSGLTVLVYNISVEWVPGQFWVVVERDKFGSWIAVRPMGQVVVEVICDPTLQVFHG